ncbi:ATP-dependent endonuclease [Vibrio cincinnatiensis]|uniref:Putative ATP-dependent endonuclease of the OLD family n=1 Tax=Vibrio cincinnatiensis DSM 19608 TaxID=1123491 RepID=A0A1T4LRN6_VIBCI|nr:ATP-dependent endonuclease [Vibrio cincinnatiensis]MCG3722040.1 ATP-dependent endonuclease [Vibrio cincinnatiensis]SJZ57363.1 putative ATP-dependent endonuclease of the OLD family [Vibrio cincinnatiensis DSM 19608]SUP06218.1 ATP-dependent endonuclease [Vibrio cincinnatiensis]
MHLERIEILGFRGIRRLSLTFDELTTLIGENTWGKSSLLDALSIMLPPDGKPYPFELQDFHVDYALSHPQTQDIQIILSFVASDKQEHRAGRYRKLKPVWRQDENGYHRIIYRVNASRVQYEISTHYAFLDLEGEVIPVHDSEQLARLLMSLHPVIRLRDSRQFDRPFVDSNGKNARVEKRIHNTCRRLMAIPGHVNKGEMRSSLNSMQALVEHYFSFKDQKRKNPRRERESLVYGPPSHDKSLSQMVDDTKNRQTRLLLMGLLNAYLQAKGPNDLRRYARPILIIEDPEGRLHPTHLARAWNLLDLLPMQKILTTNSGDLLASVPLHSIRRLVRTSDKVVATSMPSRGLGRDELRRIGFHIRFHRPGALFARCWLLVEGETEVWLFSELARQCGYNLAAEGVQIIEFAQSGLKSLIKVAKAFAIEWHVVTDGDPAGKKYASTVLNMLEHDQARHRLTELPDRDIEHFLYSHGFEFFFKDMVKIPHEHPIPAKKVVNKVLKKHAKPDLALAIVSHCEENGVESIPVLLRWTLKRVVTMANGNI